MLYIVLSDGHEIEWHVGEPRPEIFQRKESSPRGWKLAALVDADNPNAVALRTVIEVQADGHELKHIHELFTNLPYSKCGGVVRWFGDHAAFIAANL